ncbi:hypothetical protein D3C76_937840 [compost metagenome]
MTGESACASPENFDFEIGCKIAKQNAEQKIWPLMGYELKQRLSEKAQEPIKCTHKLKQYSDYLHGHECELCGEVVSGRR